jgi:L-alanine-DL-glutamate epimerase-like enolase superfamily enzyme
MIITRVDAFPLAMPEITEAADGTQDTLLVRVTTDAGITGWGECDSSPLVCLATYVCPMSHGNIINIRESLIGETLDTPDDVRRLHDKSRSRGLDIEQIDHAYSGADIALWDALGKHLGEPVYRLLGDEKAYPKLPYASVLFGDTPDETREVAKGLAAKGYRAAKFGWGPMGKHGEDFDVALVRAAREGMGLDAEIMIDAGVAWGTDWETAYRRACAFAEYSPTWLEEPLLPDAINEFRKLMDRKPPVPIATGEGSNRVRTAEDLLENGRVNFIQIDAGRVGGITAAKQVCNLAVKHGATYVNHTFKSHLSIASSLHIFAGVEDFGYLEYPADGSDLSDSLSNTPLLRDDDGFVRVPEKPGLGVEIDLDVVRKYLRPVRIEMAGEVLVDISSIDGGRYAAM